VVGTTFDGPMYADVGSDLVRSRIPILTRICRGIHICLAMFSAKYGTQRRTPRHTNSQTLLFATSNVTIVMRNPANPDHKTLHILM
jgi:hypothetical protein